MDLAVQVVLVLLALEEVQVDRWADGTVQEARPPGPLVAEEQGGSLVPVAWAVALVDSAQVILLEEARPVRLALRVEALVEAVTMVPTWEQEVLALTTPLEPQRAADLAPEVAPEEVLVVVPLVEWGLPIYLEAPASAVVPSKALGLKVV